MRAATAKAAAAAAAAAVALAGAGFASGQLQGGVPVFTGDMYAGGSARPPWGGADPLAGGGAGAYDPAASVTPGGDGALAFPTLSDALAGGGTLPEAYLESMQRLEEQIIVAAEENDSREIAFLLRLGDSLAAQDPGSLMLRGFAVGLPLEVAAKQARNKAVRTITEAMQESWPTRGALPAELAESLDEAAYGAAREGNKGTTNILVDAGASAEMASAGAVAGGEKRLDRHIRNRYDLGDLLPGGLGGANAQQVADAERSYRAVPGADADYYEEGPRSQSGNARRRRWYCLWVCRTRLSDRESDAKRRKEYARQRERDMQALGTLARQNGIRYLSGDLDSMEWPSGGSDWGDEDEWGAGAYAVEVGATDPQQPLPVSPEAGQPQPRPRGAGAASPFSGVWDQYEQPRPETEGSNLSSNRGGEETAPGTAATGASGTLLRQKSDCRKVPERGSCTSDKIYYYYDSQAGECKMFLWGGCGGNFNRFEKQEECEAFCGFTYPGGNAGGARGAGPGGAWGIWSDDLQPEAPVAPTLLPAREPEAGVMDGLSQSYNHWAEVEQGNPTDLGLLGARAGPERCSLGLDSGSGKASISAFYFDTRTQSCLPFTYSGFEGNANRFSSVRACEAACHSGATQTRDRLIDVGGAQPRLPTGRVVRPGAWDPSAGASSQPAADDNIDPFTGRPRSLKLRVPQCGNARDMKAPAFEVPPYPGGPMVLSVERASPQSQVLIFVGTRHAWHQSGLSVPAGLPCEGTPLDLQSGWNDGADQVRAFLVDADAAGAAFFKLDQVDSSEPNFCRKYVIQAVDAASCQTSNTHDARGIMP